MKGTESLNSLLTFYFTGWGDSMAKNLASQLNDIERKLASKLKKVMEEDVASEVIKEGQTQVIKEVYEKYTPAPAEYGGYERTYGLLEDWEVESIENGVIVRSDRYEDGSNGKAKYIPEVIESGEGYDYSSADGDSGFEQPRPFIQKAKSELKKKGTFKKVLKRGLGKYVKVK